MGMSATAKQIRYHRGLLAITLVALLGWLAFVQYMPFGNQYQCVQRRRGMMEPYKNSDSHLPVCQEQQNNVLIKVHKSGSTTLANVFLRYAFQRHLSVLLPLHGDKVWLDWPAPFSGKHLSKPYALSSRQEPYNLIAHHSVYNKTNMQSIMPKHTMYFAILREPFQNFKSAFRYYKVPTQLKMKTNFYTGDPLFEFLKNPEGLDKPYLFNGVPCSLTRNLMSADLGLPAEHYHDDARVEEYILQIDRDFRLVLILEYLDESLVLMRRYLCWPFRDILYMPVNVAKKPKNPNTVKTDDNRLLEMKMAHIKWSTADYKFYDYFNQTLWRKIDNQDSDFWNEVAYLKKIKTLILDFCEKRTEPLLRFDESRWHEEFELSENDCLLMRLTDLQFTDILSALYKSTQPKPIRRVHPLNPWFPRS